MEKINYHGWENCYRLTNAKLEMVVTTDVGPRIIRFGFIGEENQFQEFPEMLGKKGGSEWCMYGGHRLWHAPEHQPRTYYPDNQPVKIEAHDNFTRIIQPDETTTRIQKELDIFLSDDKAEVKIIHRLRNHNLWAIEFAPWAISVMSPGGCAIIPLPPRGSHQGNLLPENTFTLWAYTDLSDPRWTWARNYIMLRQDPDMSQPQKIGVLNKNGWMAYLRNGHLFIKKFEYQQGSVYPDWGSSVETFTNDKFIELETLGPLKTVEPGEAVEHVETWFLIKNIPDIKKDTDIEQHIIPMIENKIK